VISENTRKIKIVYLIDFLRTVQAGTEKQLAFLLENLPRAGYDVNLISLQDSPFLTNDAHSLFPSINIVTLKASADISKSPGAIVRLYSLLRRLKPDIIHTFFTTANTLGILAARMAGFKHCISSRRDMGFNISNLDLCLLRLANRFTSRIMVNSENVKQYVIDHEHVNPNHVEVVYNAISIGDGIANIERTGIEQPIIGIVANLNRPVKRVELFIKAAALIKCSHKGARFCIIGDGHLRRGFERLTADLGLGSSVTFLGRRDDVQRQLQNMTVGVLCSDSEGLSNAIMEYMVASLPVVATDVGGNRELVRHGKTGILVPPNNENAIASAVMDLLDDPNKCADMGRAGREFIKSNFSAEKMQKETCNVYEAVREGGDMINRTR
jgi:glycosyltransferase involved in cell wall biosynthesis